MRKLDFAYAKTKAQISCAVTAQLISAFVFASQIVLFLVYLNPKCQASSFLLQLYRLVCVGPGRKPQRTVFSRRGSYESDMLSTVLPCPVQKMHVLVKSIYMFEWFWKNVLIKVSEVSALFAPQNFAGQTTIT